MNQSNGRPPVLLPYRLLVATSLLAASAPGYVSAAAAAPPALAGTTVVTGSRTAGMRVRLPKAVTVRFDHHRQAVAGSGRVVGVVLTHADLDDWNRPTYSYLRFGFCGTPGCRAKSTNEFGFGFNTVEQEGGLGSIRLPRGDYQLYVIADGAPVTVTMKLPGLRGTTRLRPHVRNGFGPSSPPVRTTATPTNGYYGAGRVHEFRGGGGGMSVQAIGLQTDAWAAGQVGDCLYVERPAVPELAFQPQCPGGGSVRVVDGVVTPIPLERQYYFNAYLRNIPGVLGHGAWYTAAAKVREVHIPSLQLEFARIR